MNTRYQTIFFRVSAYWNAAWGIAIFFGHSTLFVRLGLEVPSAQVYVACAQMTGAAVTLFGVGYYLLSISIEKYSIVGWAGVIGKVITFLVFTNGYLADSTMLPLALAGAGDLIFAALFVRELKAHKR